MELIPQKIISGNHVTDFSGNPNEITVDTEIEVKLIPRKYFFAFAFVLILIGQMIFRINDYIDTSPRI